MKRLVPWFLENAAALPWRASDLHSFRDPYAVWISEIMLQQTQVAAVREHYKRWMSVFPDIATLAKAKEETVLKNWQGLGYYSRAKNILKTAQILAKEYGGKFPENRSEIEKLPGIGKYTAGAILSFAFHRPEAILDGNLIRVFSRFYLLDFLPEQSSQSEIYWNYAKQAAIGKDAFLINEALMELGRGVCKVKNPDCSNCPLCKSCKAYIQSKVERFPPKKERKYTAWHGVIAVLESADGMFFTSTGNSPFLKNQPTFPHFETADTIADGLPAEIDRIFNGIEISEFHFGKTFSHSITHHKITMRPLYLRTKLKAKAITKMLQKTHGESANLVSKEEASNLPSSLCQKALLVTRN